MTEHIGPLARRFPGMAALIDQDRVSPILHEAIGNTARVAAARAAAVGMVAGRLWDDDGAALLAAGDAFHAVPSSRRPGRPRHSHGGAKHGAGR
jgi:hypothetical protein